MKSVNQARLELDQLAAQATKLGYQVTFSLTSITEGHAAGHKSVGITISTVTEA